jgi:hypothetical protein
MNTTIDLDINNYSIEELYNFFKLSQSQNNITEENVYNAADKMMKNILNTPVSSDEKYNYINFIIDAKQILQTNIKSKNKIDLYDNILTKNIKNPDYLPQNQTPYNNVGKIINPMSISHQSLQYSSIPSNSVNPYTGNILVTNYVFNTIYRDNFFFTQPEDCTFTLPIKIKNVVSISLSAVQIPNVMLAFSVYRGTDKIYIYEENTGLNGLVIIPTGNYDNTTFPSILQDAINLQIIGSLPGRFVVTISPSTFFTTISNTTNNFKMNILRPPQVYLGDCLNFKYNTDSNPDNVVNKNNINAEASKFVSTMGYLIGYRQIEYSGLNSYTSESMFNNNYCDYVYFCMNEFTTGSQYIANYGILPSGLIDDNILAVVPITTPQFVSTFADNADFIYKTRSYNGPIDIQKISIKLLNPQGKLVNIHNFDYGFNLQISTIYDIMQPYTSNMSVN